MGDFLSNTELAEERNSDVAKAVLPVTVFVALIDLTSCLTTIPGEIVTQSFWYTYPVPEICKTKSFFNIFTVCASALCLLLIAVDRYRKVCKPLGWQIKPKMAIFLSICTLVIAGIVATPVTFYWGVQHYNITNNKFIVNVTSCETDDIYKNTEYPLMYSSITEAIISIPLVVMAVLYSLIACKIRKDIDRTHTAESGTADSLEIGDSANNTTGKGAANIREAGKLNDNIDETNEGKDPYTVIPAIDGKIEDLNGFPGERLEDISPNSEQMNTEIETVIDNNDIFTSRERVDVAKQKSKYVKQKSKHIQTKSKYGEAKSKYGETERKDNSKLVPITSISFHVKISDDIRKLSSGRVNHDIKRKTLIMFILSLVFVISTILYLTLLSLIARKDNILKTLSPKEMAVYFFFFRFYFIHHVINPFVYFLLDSYFKKALIEMTQLSKKRESNPVVTNETLTHHSN
ncbi:hypothetical protein CHS0354_008276 [Potamilus streckersoni]|uniref:G-protein coupled receptors family 1 profile domain-containing protein n=1 Tax=Potamilus streckersoni TaxID=2493646 RepID=A0AAE0SIC6_9BIVA|nr:hypothetical protein CHS0354_008276 [Potamilus streckersoni]